MTPLVALRVLASAVWFVLTERLSVDHIYVLDKDSCCIRLTPADFALFMRRHHLRDRMTQCPVGANTYCEVRFRRCLNVSAKVTYPEDRREVDIERPVLTSRPHWPADE